MICDEACDLLQINTKFVKFWCGIAHNWDLHVAWSDENWDHFEVSLCENTVRVHDDRYVTLVMLDDSWMVYVGVLDG